MNYSLGTPRSTQILDENIKADKRIRPHISIRTQISNLFEIEPEHIHAISEPSDESVKVLEKMQCRHGLVAAVLQAYNGHQHLCFSPDDIWLTIAQGISAHINFNFENDKKKFIRIDEKQSITWNECGSSRDWSKCVESIVEEATKLIEKIDLKSLLECNFSTSTPGTMVASRVILLDTVKDYFSYNMGIFCGIPKITLEGKLEDWLLIQEKLIQIRNCNLDLDFWLDDLDSIICQFIDTFKGKVDQRFWKNIAREEYGCGGPPELTGWITKFFPYDCHGNLINDWLDESTLPDGRISVRLNIEEGGIIRKDNEVHPGEKEAEDLLFVAGFLGLRQQIIEGSDEEVIVKPVIGWAIVDDKVKQEPSIMNHKKASRTRLFWC